MENIKPKIGWIGLGLMGLPMCEHLVSAGYKVYVYNRTESKAKEVVDKGAIFMAPEKIAAECEIICLMLGYPQDVKDMLLDKQAILNHMKPNTIVIDHTTSSPTLVEELYAKCKEKNLHFLDAPVSGTGVVAKSGKLAVMVGGDKDTFEKVQEVLKHYGSNIRYMGTTGKGQHTKIIAQICLAINLQGVVEALIYGYKKGLDMKDVFSLLENSGASSYALTMYGKKFVERDFNPTFFVEYFVKDLSIVLDEARRSNMCLPCLSLIKQFYQATMAQGGPSIAFHGLLLVLEQMNNIHLPGEELLKVGETKKKE